MKQRINRMFFGKKERRIDVFYYTKLWRHYIGGIITSKQFNDKVGIIVDDKRLLETDTHYACFAVRKDRTVPHIIITKDIYYSFMRGCPMARTIIFHELGHYAHGDIGESFDTDCYDEERIESVKNGQVLEIEKSADEFAVSYLGKNVVIEGLTKLKKIVESESEDDLATLELQLRIEAINKTNNP